MQRREFLAASAAAGLALVSSTSSRAAEGVAGRDLIELRVYRFASSEKLAAFDEFLGKAMIPALNRAGVSPVGVFKLQKGDPKAKQFTETDLFVLLTHKSADSYLTLADKLAADADYQAAGKATIDAARKDPAYTTVETSLFLAFPHAPKVEKPTSGPDRIMQLRYYTNHNDEQARRKMHMFDEGGELDLFKKAGMNWVFFGRALSGDRMPNLTYMLTFENADAQAKGWKAFVSDPGWPKLKNGEFYKDAEPTLIVNLILKPTGSSQI